MAEGFEPYHVAQQSRRDRLRVGAAQDAAAAVNFSGCTGLLPFYDPSLLPAPDSLTCPSAGASHHHHQQQPPGSLGGGACKPSSVKEEGGANHMIRYLGNGGGEIVEIAASPTPNFLDLPTGIPIQEISTNPFFYSSQNLRDLDQQTQAFNGSSGFLGFKPPETFLSLTHPESNLTSTGQGLSLSLSSSQNNANAHHHHQLGTLPLELNLQHSYPSPAPALFRDATKAGGATASGDAGSRAVSAAPVGPFTGYASILKESRFLRPAQQLLEEFCDLGREIYCQKIAAAAAAAAPLADSPAESLGSVAGIGGNDGLVCGGDASENGRKKSSLLSMLDEVYGKYKQYYQQLQAVVASFESVAGLGNAAPFANFAIKSMSRHFRCLKTAITDQLQFTNKAYGDITHGKEEAQRFGNSDRGLYSQRSVQNSGYLEHQPVWRPQRGLPERAVTVLRAWLFEHFLHPYPTDTDKLMLAKQTGLSRSQVSNWFINARVRLWKPMVEEIHLLETRQAKKAAQREEPSLNRTNDQLPSADSLASENPSASSTQRVQETQYKGTRNEFLDASLEPIDLSYSDLPSHPQLASGVSMTSGSSSVSLTLGLQNGINFLEPFPVNSAQRFGLGVDPNGGGYVMGGGFEAQNRNLERNVIGGQLLRDFVG